MEGQIRRYLLVTVCVGLTMLPIALGFTVRDVECNLYDNMLIQYEKCQDVNDIKDQVVQYVRTAREDGNLTKSEALNIIKLLCRELVSSEAAKTCIKGKLSCISGEEMGEILSKWGGFCGPDGNIPNEITQYFMFVSTSKTCKEQEAENSCVSDFDVWPDSSLNITAGISWMEEKRKQQLTCRLKKENKMPSSCGSERDLQLIVALEIILSDPPGIGANFNVVEYFK